MSEKLAERGIFILPNVIEHETYAALAELLLTRDEPVQLFCAGDGGSIRDALAMVDLIRGHGKVTGLLAGTAASCHGVVWAACAQRVVYPHGMLGVHKVGYSELNRGFDTHSAGLLSRELDVIEHMIAEIFAGASVQSPDWWYRRIQEAGSQEYSMFGVNDLVNLGMGKRAAMRGEAYPGSSRAIAGMGSEAAEDVGDQFERLTGIPVVRINDLPDLNEGTLGEE